MNSIYLLNRSAIFSIKHVVEKEGYSFTGWYTAATEGTQVTDFSKNTEDVTYYAQWKINRYTVDFIEGSSKTPISVEHGSSVALPNPAPKIGQTFKGWFTAAAGGSKITDFTSVTGPAMYYSHWSVDTVNVDFVDGAVHMPKIVNYGRSSQALMRTCRALKHRVAR